MDAVITSTAMILSAAGAAVCIWRGQRPVTVGKVRYIPWMFIGLGLAALSIMLLTHLVNLAGFETGRGRFI